MSSWIYRKIVGTDAHLVAWLEVRLFAGGAVEVLPWLENGFLRVAGPTNKAIRFGFDLGNTQRFSAAINLPNHCRTTLVAGATLSHWLGADPQVTIKHDTAYLQATALVPSYRAATIKAPNHGVATGVRGGNFPEATSYWGNLRPAIAYAVQHQVPGAVEVYRRMTSAANWHQLASGFNADPMWSVRPMLEH